MASLQSFLAEANELGKKKVYVESSGFTPEAEEKMGTKYSIKANKKKAQANMSSSMFLMSDFSNKKNKAKRRAAELDMAVRLGGTEGADKANLAKVRARRNQTFVDPLAYRSTLKKDKVFQPYALDSSKSSTIPKWADKSRGISERMKIGGILGTDFISTKPSESEKVIEKVRKIDADRFAKKLNAMPKSDITPMVKPKGDKRFLIGAGLGLVGLTGLALANRRKKENNG